MVILWLDTCNFKKKAAKIVFKKYINAPWFLMKDFPVGTASNTNIQETQLL